MCFTAICTNFYRVNYTVVFTLDKGEILRYIDLVKQLLKEDELCLKDSLDFISITTHKIIIP